METSIPPERVQEGGAFPGPDVIPVGIEMETCIGLDLLAGQFTREYEVASPQSPDNILTCSAKGKATCLHASGQAGGQLCRREHRHIPHPLPHTAPATVWAGLLLLDSAPCPRQYQVSWARSPPHEKVLATHFGVRGFYLKPYVLKIHECGRSFSKTK